MVSVLPSAEASTEAMFGPTKAKALDCGRFLMRSNVALTSAASILRSGTPSLFGPILTLSRIVKT